MVKVIMRNIKNVTYLIFKLLLNNFNLIDLELFDPEIFCDQCGLI